MRHLCLIPILLLLAFNAAGQGRKILVDALLAQQRLDSTNALVIVRQEANEWRNTVYSRDRTIDSLKYANAQLRGAQDSTKAAYQHQLALDRDKDVQIASLQAKATRRGLTTVLSFLANLGLGYFIIKH